MLGGIGFTMSLFIAGLSLDSPEMLNYSKLGILLGSLLAATAGLVFLSFECALLSVFNSEIAPPPRPTRDAGPQQGTV